MAEEKISPLDLDHGQSEFHGEMSHEVGEVGRMTIRELIEYHDRLEQEAMVQEIQDELGIDIREIK